MTIETSKNSNQIEFCGTVERETGKAFLVSDGITETWLPKSQIVKYRRIGGSASHHDFEFFIPEWLAKDKGII
jgi:hypothetical protein